MIEPSIKALTKKQVEDFILLASQSDKRWFKLVFTDEEMQKDPTATALMEALSDVIHEGIFAMAMNERMTQAKEDTKGQIDGSH